jgi:D-psicose/D-tagatose/L-ribulose 3-epimerase
MRFGAHCYIFIDKWTDHSLAILDTAKELGLDCFELGVGDDVHFTPHLTRAHASSLGLELFISPGGHWPREHDLSASDPQQRDKALAWHQRQVDVGAELGATAYTGALYGHPGVLSYHPPTEAENRRTAEGLHQLAEYGHRRGVRVVIEPMSHFRTHVANTAQQAMHLLELADHANLSMLIDTYHLMTETRDYASQIRCAQGRLWGLHACENDRGAPGTGLVPWDQVFGALKEIGFNGYLVFESYNSTIGDPPGSFAYRRSMLHNVCPDGSAFVKEGMDFLRRSLQAINKPQEERA